MCGRAQAAKLQLPRSMARSNPFGHTALARLARQLGWALATLFVVSIVTFAATSLRSPEDVARQALGRSITQEQIQSFVERRGLDRPVTERYVEWLSNFVRGDWGRSVLTDAEVRPQILPRLWRSLLLAGAALAISVPVGLLLGVSMARRWGKPLDLAMVVICVVLSAFPEFVTAIGLILVFAVGLNLLPVDSTALTFGTLGDQVAAYALPTATLAIAVIPYIARITRAAGREALTAPFTRAAVLRGLSQRTVVWDHALRNASAPILNAIALNLIYLLGGVIVVENVFGFPGIGQALIQSVQRADVVTVQAISLVLGLIFVTTNLITDVLATYANPRLRRQTS